MMDDGRPGDIALEGEAPLVGGNLSLLAHLVGTPYQVDTKDSFLVIEDIGEKPYAVDRYLTQLGEAGVFDDCLGVIVGEFTQTGESAGEVEATIRERLGAFDMPSLWGAPVGHGSRNRAFSFGGNVSVEGGTLRLTEPAVSRS
jgi:muramoyltetrapeptide carboxypeptidase